MMHFSPLNVFGTFEMTRRFFDKVLEAFLTAHLNVCFWSASCGSKESFCNKRFKLQLQSLDFDGTAFFFD